MQYKGYLLGIFGYKQKTVCLQAKDFSLISKRPFGYKQKPSQEITVYSIFQGFTIAIGWETSAVCKSYSLNLFQSLNDDFL